jgi:hypothetical protein
MDMNLVPARRLGAVLTELSGSWFLVLSEGKMDMNLAQIVIDGMGRFVERFAHKPSLHHSAYSVRTGQCVSFVVRAA